MTSFTLQVAPESHGEQNEAVQETKVEVNILNSPPLILTVPSELELQDPAFIQYVAQEALQKYKEMVRWEPESLNTWSHISFSEWPSGLTSVDRGAGANVCLNLCETQLQYSSTLLWFWRFLQRWCTSVCLSLQVWRWLTLQRLPLLSTSFANTTRLCLYCRHHLVEIYNWTVSIHWKWRRRRVSCLRSHGVNK